VSGPIPHSRQHRCRHTGPVKTLGLLELVKPHDKIAFFSRNLRQEISVPTKQTIFHDIILGEQRQNPERDWLMITEFTDKEDAITRKLLFSGTIGIGIVCGAICLVDFRYAFAGDHCLTVNQSN
jgi:hypothetical protein